jgi:hypothetical protein
MEVKPIMKKGSKLTHTYICCLYSQCQLPVKLLEFVFGIFILEHSVTLYGNQHTKQFGLHVGHLQKRSVLWLFYGAVSNSSYITFER